jgi:hypothetical protein
MSSEPRIGRWRTAAEEMLLQRQLRAAEIALENDRHRRFAEDDELRSLRSFAEAAEAMLADSVAARELEAQAFRAQLAAADTRALTAEQGYTAERNRRRNLEQALAAVAAERSRRDDLVRQLAAEQRIRELEGELELVMRHAAAFEYGVRMAAFDAFRLVREMTDRVEALLSRAGLVPASRPASGPAGDGTAASGPGVDDGFDAARLDAALERLRAGTPPSPEPE